MVFTIKVGDKGIITFNEPECAGFILYIKNTRIKEISLSDIYGYFLAERKALEINHRCMEDSSCTGFEFNKHLLAIEYAKLALEFGLLTESEYKTYFEKENSKLIAERL